MIHFLGRHLSLRSCIMVGVDCVLIFLTILLLSMARLGFDMEMLFIYDPYLVRTSAMAAVHVLCMGYFELYSPVSYRLSPAVLRKIMQSIIMASGILFVFYYFYPPLKVGRGIWIGSFIALPGVLVAWRWLYSTKLSGEFSRERILIMGSGSLAKKIARGILDCKELGMDIIGFLDRDTSRLGYSLVNPRIVGSYDDLEEVVSRQGVNRIIIALPDRRNRIPMETILNCKLRGISIEDGESIFERIMGRIPLDQLRPSWMVFGEGFYLMKVEKLMKRVFDVAVALVGLAIFSPVFIVAPVLIKLGSPGPVFFRQQRIGEGGRMFTLIKFRTMREADPSVTNRWAQNDDDRITGVGRLLRRTRLDEAPQLINVLKGDMSIVGPRPDIPYLREEMGDKIPYYSLRYSLKPGVTGWAQIKYRYVSSVEEGAERHEYDLYYIKNFSLLFDFWIMLKTVQVMLAKAGAR